MNPTVDYCFLVMFALLTPAIGINAYTSFLTHSFAGYIASAICAVLILFNCYMIYDVVRHIIAKKSK